MSFPSLPLDPKFIPSDEQKNAFKYILGGGAPFANPLNSFASSIQSQITAPVGGAGGFDLHGLETKIKSLIMDDPTLTTVSAPDPTTGATTSTTKKVGLTESEANALIGGLSSVGLGGFTSTSMLTQCTSMSDAISSQTSTLLVDVEGKPTFHKNMSLMMAYSSAKESYGDVNGGNLTPVSMCDSMKSLVGTLGGAVDDLKGQCAEGFDKLHEQFGKVSASVKSDFNDAISEFKSLGSDTDITAAVSTLRTKMSTFVTDTRAELTALLPSGTTIENEINSLKGQITEGMSGVTSKIHEELQQFNGVTDYLQKVSITNILPTISSPCAKSAVSEVVDATGSPQMSALISRE